MLFSKTYPMLPGQLMPDVKEDYRTAQKIGPCRVSAQAFYGPDGGYLLRSSIQEAIAGKGSAHVTGCCAGGVPVPRLVIVTEQKKFPLLLDSENVLRQLEAILNGTEE